MVFTDSQASKGKRKTVCFLSVEVEGTTTTTEIIPKSTTIILTHYSSLPIRYRCKQKKKMLDLRVRAPNLFVPANFSPNAKWISTGLFLYAGRRDHKTRIGERERGVTPTPTPSPATPRVDVVLKSGEEGQFGNLVSEFGWRVRRLVEDEDEDEMRKVSLVQAQAFHVPVALFNDIFFDFFKAEVLSGLMYKLRSSPRDRYACLVAEPKHDSDFLNDSKSKLVVGVVDITALRDKTVLGFLQGAEEYLYVSGIAVSEEFRRQKVATVLLKACDALSRLWGFSYLVLRAYDDDEAALRLYRNAGYRIVSGDPPWLTSWIGRKRRVLMIKCSSIHVASSNS